MGVLVFIWLRHPTKSPSSGGPMSWPSLLWLAQMKWRGWHSTLLFLSVDLLFPLGSSTSIACESWLPRGTRTAAALTKAIASANAYHGIAIRRCNKAVVIATALLASASNAALRRHGRLSRRSGTRTSQLCCLGNWGGGSCIARGAAHTSTCGGSCCSGRCARSLGLTGDQEVGKCCGPHMATFLQCLSTSKSNAFRKREKSCYASFLANMQPDVASNIFPIPVHVRPIYSETYHCAKIWSLFIFIEIHMYWFPFGEWADFF